MPNTNYVLITAARNEEAYIRKTLEAVVTQTRPPRTWFIVSDGSTDRTDEFVRDFARRFDFIELLHLGRSETRSFSSKAFALNTAYQEIRHIESDFVGILDADVSIPCDYYEELLARFEVDPRMGLAGGVIVEASGSCWKMRHTD